MTADGEENGVHRLRALGSRVAAAIGGVSAVRTLLATLAVFDAAGGGLVAAGLAYTALIALLPGLLLVLSVVGLVVGDPAVRERLVNAIATALPPLEDVARSALKQVSDGAVPTGIVALVALLWGASRFYAALDTAFARIFQGVRRRGGVEQTVRGLVLTALLVTLPALALIVGSIGSWLLDMAPAGVVLGDAVRTVWQVASPIGSLVLFIVGTALVYRYVPAERVPARALRLPAVLAGLALAAFTQAFAFVAARLVGAAALYGAFVAVFAILAWLSIGFNVLLLGAAWTRVRALAQAPGPVAPGDGAHDEPGGGARAAPGDGRPIGTGSG